jgi:hypothetical protein
MKGTAQLQDIYEKDGRRFGKVIEHIELPVLSLKADGKRKKLAKDDKMVIQVHHDCCLDGSAHVGSMKVVDYLSTTTKENDGIKYTLKVVFKGERDVSFTEPPKKK